MVNHHHRWASEVQAGQMVKIRRDQRLFTGLNILLINVKKQSGTFSKSRLDIPVPHFSVCAYISASARSLQLQPTMCKPPPSLRVKGYTELEKFLLGCMCSYVACD